MAFEQIDYERRLPYGYWFGPAQKREYLFDRGYRAIASRHTATPWLVTAYEKRRFIDAGGGRVEMHFYNDGSSPVGDRAMLAVCEKVLARFMLGRDIRFWLIDNANAKPLPTCLVPKTDARYVPTRVPPQMLAVMSAKDCTDYVSNAGSTVADLLG